MIGEVVRLQAHVGRWKNLVRLRISVGMNDVMPPRAAAAVPGRVEEQRLVSRP
jgi:hypothetical protein